MGSAGRSIFNEAENSSLSFGNCSLPYANDRLPLLTLYGIVFIVGVPANMVTIYLTCLEVHKKNVLGIYLLSLSVCDMMYLGTLPSWAIYIYSEHSWQFSPLACKITGYIFFNNMYISIFLLCCVSVDRYIAVVYSMKSHNVRQIKWAVLNTLVIVAVVGLVHMPVFNMPEGDTEGNKQCFEPGHSTGKITAFNYARFVFGFLIPLCILLVTNRAILTMVQASEGLSSEQKAKVRYLILAVIVLYLVCFAPYHIILLLRAISYHFSERSCTIETTMYSAYTISLGLSTLNSAMNPILYVLASDNMRKEVCRCKCCLCTCFHSRQETKGDEQKNCTWLRSSGGTQEVLMDN